MRPFPGICALEGLWRRSVVIAVFYSEYRCSHPEWRLGFKKHRGCGLGIGHSWEISGEHVAGKNTGLG